MPLVVRHHLTIFNTGVGFDSVGLPLDILVSSTPTHSVSGELESNKKGALRRCEFKYVT